MSRYSFKTVGGERFEVELSIDPAKVAEALAHRLTRQGRASVKALDGAIVATRVNS